MGITKEDVLNVIAKASFTWETNGIINVGSIVRLTNASRYKANKFLHELLNDGVIERAIIPGGVTEDGPYPPLKGYKVSVTYKKTDEYRELERKDLESYRQWAESV